jgi:hypothetical protein
VSNLRFVSFEEMTGRKAGIPTIIDAPNLSQSHQPNPNLSSPFQSELDYALCSHILPSQKAMLLLSSRTRGLVLSPISLVSIMLMNGMQN